MDGYGRALSRRAHDFHAAAVPLDNVLDDGKTQARAAHASPTAGTYPLQAPGPPRQTPGINASTSLRAPSFDHPPRHLPTPGARPSGPSPFAGAAPPIPTPYPHPPPTPHP